MTLIQSFPIFPPPVRRFGACTNVTDIANPISLARILCDKQSTLLQMGRIPPMVLSGSGASHFARVHDVPIIANESLLTRKSIRHYKHFMRQATLRRVLINGQPGKEYSVPGSIHANGMANDNGEGIADDDDDDNVENDDGDEDDDEDDDDDDDDDDSDTCGEAVVAGAAVNDAANGQRMDTVGAVCVDAAGNCAAGCSSGGLLLKLSGRVGQAATYGAGCWAQSGGLAGRTVATCTTGNGEYLMRTLLAREIASDLVRSDCAATSVLDTFTHKFLRSPMLTRTPQKQGGALTLSYDAASGVGDVIWSHTTTAFCIGYQSTEAKKPTVGVMGDGWDWTFFCWSYTLLCVVYNNVCNVNINSNT